MGENRDLRYLALFPLLVTVLVVVACSQSASQSTQRPRAAAQQTTTVDASSGTDNTVNITVVAKQFAFEPDVITAYQSDTVTITAYSVDVTHGFSLPDYGVNPRLEPNVPQTATFVADKKGTFPFFSLVITRDGRRRRQTRNRCRRRISPAGT